MMIENDSIRLLCEEVIIKPLFYPEATVDCSKALTNMTDVVGSGTLQLKFKAHTDNSCHSFKF